MKLFLLEEKLIEEANMGNPEEALDTYYQMFKLISKNSSDKISSIRFVKNYLISLNQSLYKNFCKNISCKYSMYKIRNNFMEEIEKNNCINHLYNLGREIISYYSNTTIERCICTENPIVKEALNYIHKYINEDLSLEKVAHEIHVSKNHLSTLFARCTGYNFSSYVNNAKIEKSKALLKNTNNSILNIAIECGFNSQSYFCSTFKKTTGITPTDYRMKSLKEESK